MSSAGRITARERVITAVLRVLSAERASEHAHKADEQDHAAEQLDEAAVHLTAANSALVARMGPELTDHFFAELAERDSLVAELAATRVAYAELATHRAALEADLRSHRRGASRAYLLDRPVVLSVGDPNGEREDGPGW